MSRGCLVYLADRYPPLLHCRGRTTVVHVETDPSVPSPDSEAAAPAAALSATR